MRIVLKFGSGVLANPEGTTLDEPQFRRIAAEVGGLVRGGCECLIVSSGAVAAGLGALGLHERPEELSARQACAAIGQVKLMQMYATMFEERGLHAAQLLLTHGDLDSRTRHQNARATLDRLFERRTVVPVINENDSVAVEELKFGDNDRLSAEVAILAAAEKLILLTSVDGLLDERGETVPEVNNIDAVTSLVRHEKGRLSIGGMKSKLQAVKLAIDAGIPTWIASGRKEGQITAIAAGQPAGTRFSAPVRREPAGSHVA